MANNFQAELDQLQGELMPHVNKLQTQLVQTLEGVEKKCLAEAKDSVDSFVKCMVKKTKNIEKEEKYFQFKLAFMQQSVFQCFQQAKDKGEPLDKCKAQAKDNLDRYLNELITSINK